jgi:hypothetical protein
MASDSEDTQTKDTKKEWPERNWTDPYRVPTSGVRSKLTPASSNPNTPGQGGRNV